MNKIRKKDIEEFVLNFKLSTLLKDSKFLVLGATGLIGSTLVHCLLAINKGVEVFCPVRDLSKAQNIYGKDSTKIHFIECDLLDYLKGLTEEDSFDFIVHCASPTNGKYMIEHPVETYMLAIDSTRLILEHARKTNARGVVYLSSLEYYGQNFDDNIVTEDMQGFVDNTDSRSSYPLAKRAAEYICTAYYKQYGVNVKVARLTQTFGAGVSIEDNRVFAQFARSVIENKDIVLHTSGESSKPYCYTTDCISAILYILLYGANGEVYNVANSDTYISIKEMAKFLRDNFNDSINVIVEEHPEMGYAPVTKLNLSVDKLKKLGWIAKYDLKGMYERLIDSML